MAASLEADQRLLVRTVSDSAASSRPLFDACVPAEHRVEWSVSGIWTWLTASPAAFRTARQTFQSHIRDAVLPLLRGSVSSSQTGLIETILLVSKTTDRFASLWLFSDMLESAKVDAEALLAGQSTTLIDALPQVPKLDGVIVHVAGIGRFHDQYRRGLTPKEEDALREAWQMFISHAGGRFEDRLIGASSYR
jgi:hypothetical protein